MLSLIDSRPINNVLKKVFRQDIIYPSSRQSFEHRNFAICLWACYDTSTFLLLNGWIEHRIQCLQSIVLCQLWLSGLCHHLQLGVLRKHLFPVGRVFQQIKELLLEHDLFRDETNDLSIEILLVQCLIYDIYLAL